MQGKMLRSNKVQKKMRKRKAKMLKDKRFRMNSWLNFVRLSTLKQVRASNRKLKKLKRDSQTSSMIWLKNHQKMKWNPMDLKNLAKILKNSNQSKNKTVQEKKR